MSERLVGRGSRRARRTREQSPYEILGVAEGASAEEIRKAYLAMVRRSPPERDPEGFKRIRKAYGVLRDIARRKVLDLSLFRKDSGLDIAQEVSELSTDWGALFRERVFQLLLSSSDLYVQDFSRDFAHLEDEIRGLR